MAWEPAQYLKFQKERFAPFEDCLALVERRAALSVVDLGCGTGELTRRLADALPDADVTGIDSSPEMLDKARAQERPGVRFSRGTIEETRGTWDLVFSHAAIQWVDDHRALVPRLLELVRPGGQLVVQLPSNHGHPSHAAMRALVAEAPFAEALGGWSRQAPVLPLEAYAELLFAHGAQELTVFEKVYPHVLENADAVAEWVRGTALVPVFERLPASLHAAYWDRYREKLREHWPRGPVFFGFKRIVFAARRA